MPSTSFQFLGFALAAVAVSHLHWSARWRQTVLLTASILFLLSFSAGARSYIPLLAFILLGYAGVRWIQFRRNAPAMPVLIATVAAFVWLKKYSFVPASLYLTFPYLTVGLSYILFRLLHLMIEARDGKLPECPGPLSYLTYLLNFTTLLSGPIQPYPEFARMETGSPRPDFPTVAAAVARIIRGLFKANVLALLASTFQSRALESLTATQATSTKVLCGAAIVALYPIFLYCNFSGYIDIVIGIARLLGLELPENFDRPFSAGNFIQFWSRWHITLSNWLKTYVYNPLLMVWMRRFPSPALETVWLALALFVTFFLVGLWHGQTSEFLFFGFLQGFGVAANRVYQIVMARRLGRKRYKALSTDPIYIAVCRGFTFTWFAFTLLWFWSNWQQIAQVAAFGWAAGAMWALILTVSTLVLAAWEAMRGRIVGIRVDGIPFVESQYWRTASCTALLVIVLAVTLLMDQAAPEIVYKAF